MKYTKGTNYALHIIAFFMRQGDKETFSLQPLATKMEMPPAYLSKILSQLVKADLIQSVSGANGGYRLRKKKEEITFFDVVRAIEGSGALFTCEMNEDACRLQRVMREAEKRLEHYLAHQTIYEAVHGHAPHTEDAGGAD
ncbi:Rrf2 family transcriptional regulator [Christensenellaceae bacterium OttesenSCG-928-L17]|nr:Rrf2 family transcriptional regulator [Christensenellaceae bacterium OttesenSCG-928-L17]